VWYTDNISGEMRALSACAPNAPKITASAALMLPSATKSRATGCTCYSPRIIANISGATMDASLSMTYLGVSIPSLPHVIFSLGTAPE
jgi:hypothetical protein